MKKKIETRKITVIALFSALSAILMFLEFSVPLVPEFLKFDFSDLPALVAAFAYGPISGVIICLVKNLLHLPFSGSAYIGELSNFILSAIYTLTAGLVYKKLKSRKGALLGSIGGATAAAVVSVFTNYFVIYPLYGKVLGLSTEVILGMYRTILPTVKGLLEALLIFNLPFTFIKGIVVAAICFVIYKPLHPILKGNSK